MKKIISTILALSLMMALLSVTAFAQVPTVEEGYDYTRFANDGITLNVYNWGEYISDGEDDSLDVIASFEELTGIDVNYTTYDTNESLYAKLSGGGGNYDIIIPSDYMIGRMASEGMLAELDFDNIPNYQFIDEAYLGGSYDPENMYSVPYMWGVVGLIYNTTMVDEADLAEGWGLFWNEKYTGQMLMFNNSRDAFAIASKYLGNSLNPTTQEEIDAATEALKEQKPLNQSYVMDEVFDKMQGNEAAIAAYYAGDGITMMENNEDLAMFVPHQGSNMYVDAMCIPATSTNKEAAEMFINYMCETEVGLANAEYIWYSTPHTEVYNALDEETRNNELMYPPAEVIENSETFDVLPDDINTAMDAAWSDVRSYEEGGSGWVVIVLVVAMVLVVVLVAVLKIRKKQRNNY